LLACDEQPRLVDIESATLNDAATPTRAIYLRIIHSIIQSTQTRHLRRASQFVARQEVR
jgi:hypothetical protein